MKGAMASALGLAVVWSIHATAQERLGDFVLLPEHHSAILTGPITSDTSVAFDAILGRMPDMKVLALHSPGGQVVSALDIANKVNALGLSTVILDTMDCASACSIIFFAGSERFALGQLGVHQLSTRGQDDIQAVQLVISNILDAFEKFGVDARVTKRMLTTRPDDMYYFSDGEKDEYLINRSEQLGKVPAPASPKTPELKFANFQPEGYHSGKPVLPDFKGEAEWARNFRTRIRDGVKEGPNFAGRFTIVEIGCGTSCRFGFLVDASNGNVLELPLGGEENYQLEITYTVESKLLKAVWMDTENNNYDTCVRQDYVLDGRQLKLLGESRYTIKEFDYCSAYK